MPSIQQASFSGHETFPFRYTWLKKAVDRVIEDPTVFGLEDAMVRFGVGKNMVGSIRHWGMVCGMLEEDADVFNNRGRSLRVSTLGHLLLRNNGWDPYLEDPASLWLLHWQVANSPERATTWYWVFNQLNRFEFTRGELVTEMLRLVEQHRWSRVAVNSVKRDVDTFVRSYTAPRVTKKTLIEETLDCPLVDLGLLGLGSDGDSLTIRRGDHPSLPDEVFAYGLIEFLRLRANQASTLSLEEMLFSPGSPGRVFCLSEAGALRRLDSLSALTKGKLSYDETAGLKQILILEVPDPIPVLRTHYRRTKA
jgi:hypothetical protein